MNKIAIPALLLGVVMIAGAFAFMPVQEASTVHLSTDTQETQMKIVHISASCTASGGDDQTDQCDTLQVDIPTGAAFEIIGMTIEKTNAQTGTGADAYDLDAVEVNGTTSLLDPEPAVTGDTANFYTLVGMDDLSTNRLVGVGQAANDDIRIDDSAGTTTDTAEIFTIHLTLLIQGDASLSNSDISLADTVS